MLTLDQQTVQTIVQAALDEDLGRTGDITSDAVIPVERQGVGKLIARAELVLAGLPVAETVFHQLDPELLFSSPCKDGMRLKRGELIASVSGRALPILRG